MLIYHGSHLVRHTVAAGAGDPCNRDLTPEGALDMSHAYVLGCVTCRAHTWIILLFCADAALGDERGRVQVTTLCSGHLYTVPP